MFHHPSTNVFHGRLYHSFDKMQEGKEENMSRTLWKKIVSLLLLFLAAWLGLHFLLPLALPFLLGALVAAGAEPLVKLCIRKLHLPRGAAAGVGVSATLLLLTALLVLLGSAAVRELGMLAGRLPQLAQSVLSGLTALQDLLLGMTARMPEVLRSAVNQSILELFGSGSALMQQLAQKLPGMAGGLITYMGSGALTLGTGLLSAFMISARLPRIRAYCQTTLPRQVYERYLPALGHIRKALWGWLRAQCKLGSISFLILTVGFLLLKVPFAPVWALLIAFVDALPMLGTGLVLLPWALVCALEGNMIQAAGLLGIYAAAALTRTALEPRFLGKHLGLDPLITLVALYAGYRLWGLPGMILAPVLAITATEISTAIQKGG